MGSGSGLDLIAQDEVGAGVAGVWVAVTCSQSSEVRTLRRKLDELSGYGRGALLQAALGRHHASARPEASYGVRRSGRSAHCLPAARETRSDHLD